MLHWTVRSPAVISRWWFLLWSKSDPIMCLRDLQRRSRECQKLPVKEPHKPYWGTRKAQKMLANKTSWLSSCIYCYCDVIMTGYDKEEAGSSKRVEFAWKWIMVIYCRCGTWLFCNCSPLKWLINAQGCTDSSLDQVTLFSAGIHRTDFWWYARVKYQIFQE